MLLPTTPFQGAEHAPFYLQGSQPAAALLVHGFPGTPAEMRPLAETLHAHGWTAQSILLPGFGAQMETILDKQVSDWVAAVREPLVALRHDHDVVIVIGYSLGGALALQAAAADVPDGLVLLAPFWQLDHWLWKLLPAFKQVFNGVQPFRLFKPDFTNLEVRAGIRNFLPDADLDDPQVQQAIRDFRLPLSLFEQIYRAGHSAHRLAPTLPSSLPVLVLQGTDDDLVRPHLTRRWLKRLNSSVQYLEVPGKHDLPKTDSVSWLQVQTAVVRFAQHLHPTPLPVGD